MSNKVAIVTDSTAYIPEEFLKQYNITVVPLTVIWGDEILNDGVDIQPHQFYERLPKAAVMPTTSQATPATMHDTFKGLINQGYDVLGVFISSKISGTIASAQQAVDMLDNGKDKVAIVDSLLTSMAMGWPVLTAARAAQAGESLADCENLAQEASRNSGILFVVDTLEFLRRGGRIGGAQALLGNVLNIKPILELKEGVIEPAGKVRTKKKALQHMLELSAERINGRTPVRIAVTHANVQSEAGAFLEAAKNHFNPIETIISPLSPVIGTHVGPGTLALTFMHSIS